MTIQKAQKAVLFDLDGTLIDTAADFIRIIKVLCQKYDRACPSDGAIREQVSAGARAMVRLLLDEKLSDDDPVLLAYRQEFLDLYEQDICVDSHVFVGLVPLLEQLENQGTPWGIVTNKPRYLAVSLLQKLALTDRCAVLVCPDDVRHTKPDPEPLLLACQKLSISPSDCVYIGDHVRDIVAGKAAGMTTVVAEFGYLSAKDKQELSTWQADQICKTDDELAQFVLAWVDK